MSRTRVNSLLRSPARVTCRSFDSPRNVCGVSSSLSPGMDDMEGATHVNAEKFDQHSLPLPFGTHPTVPKSNIGRATFASETRLRWRQVVICVLAYSV